MPLLPPPIEPLECRNAGCRFPAGGACAQAAEFSNPLGECPHLVRRAVPNIDLDMPSDAAIASPPKIPSLLDSILNPSANFDSEPAPWAGKHLGMQQAGIVKSIIAVLGAYDAGKTSLIASFFLQLANGQRDGLPYRFASSLTLLGLHEIVQRAAAWDGRENAEILAHTSRDSAHDNSGFLHLALRPAERTDDRILNIALSDVPGEVVQRWIAIDDSEARQSLPFLQEARAFLVPVDAAKLLGSEGNVLDRETSFLLRRLAIPECPRPVALVFSKFDRVIQKVLPPPAAERLNPEAWGVLQRKAGRIWQAVRVLRDTGAPVQVFAVAAFPHALHAGQPVGVVEPFRFLIGEIDRFRKLARPALPVPANASSFESMRRENLP